METVGEIPYIRWRPWQRPPAGIPSAVEQCGPGRSRSPHERVWASPAGNASPPRHPVLRPLPLLASFIHRPRVRSVRRLGLAQRSACFSALAAHVFLPWLRVPLCLCAGCACLPALAARAFLVLAARIPLRGGEACPAPRASGSASLRHA